MNKRPRNEKSILLYGKHSCFAALRNPNRICFEILIVDYVYENHKLDINFLATNKKSKIIVLDKSKFSTLVPQNAVHQGIAVRVGPLNYDLALFLQTITDRSTIIVLDQVTDPHNIGAILRSASAFNADAVITTYHNAPSENAVISKSSSGALEVIPLIYVTNLVQTIKTLKNNEYWCYGLDCHDEYSQSMNEAKFHKKSVLVLGAEGKGIRHLLKENCDFLITIPISDKVESLNVSNAAAIIIHHIAQAKYEIQ